MRIADVQRTRKGNQIVIVCDCGHEFWHSEGKWLVKCDACKVAVKLEIIQDQAERQGGRSRGY